jgi:hypothetical protein
MMMDVNQAAEIEDFLEGFNQPTLLRHAGQWGPGGNLVIRRLVV